MSGTEAFEPGRPGVAGLLSATYHFMMRRIMEELSHEGYSDLSKTQLHILARFSKGEMTLDQLARRVQVPMQIVANLAHMLSTSGYVTEVSESSILGAVRYSVSQRGYAALAIVDRGQKAVEREWVEQLGEEDVQTIIHSLSCLFNATARAAEDR